MSRLSGLTGVVLMLGAVPLSLIAQQQGRVTRDGGDVDPNGTRLLRQPAVSATQIAFVHAGDVWIVARQGGDARRLTTSPGIESFPKFSPDGRLVAFTGEYAGNQDVYVVPAEGGDPKRLTWHPGADLVRDWTIDGRRVVFASGRASDAPVGVLKLWTISIDGGLPEALPMPTANRGQFSPDGRRFGSYARSRYH